MREPDQYWQSTGVDIREIEAKSDELHLIDNINLKHLVLQTSMDGFWLADLQGHLLDVNEAYCRLSGYSRSELLCMTINDIDAVESREETNRHIEKVVRLGYDRFESRQLRRDGGTFYVEVSVHYQPVDGGRLVAFLRDITDRKSAEAQACRNEARLQSIVNIMQYRSEGVQDFLDHSLHEAIKLTDSRVGYIYFYNEDRQDLVLNTWSGIDINQCRVKEQKTVYKLDKTGIWGEAVRQRRPLIINDFQAGHPLKKGYPEGHIHLTSFMTVPVFMNGRIVAVVGLGNKADGYDQTDVLQLSLLMETVWKTVEIKKGEERLRESESRYRSLFNQSFVGIFVHDRQGRIIDANQMACRQSGYTREELLDLTVFDLHPDNTNKGWILDQWHQWEPENRFTLEAEHRHKNGHNYPVEISTGIMRHEDNELMLAVVYDLSERKKFEQEKAALETQLQKAQKMEAIGTLAGGIAHDFNNILFPIIGRCEMLLDDLSDESELSQHIQSIMDSANRAAGLVKQILAFSRQSEVGRMPVRIQKIIEEVLALVRHSIPSTIDLSLSIDETREAVMADAGQIHQVIMNLISNAYHAMENNGGRLEIGLKTIEIGPDSDVAASLSQGRYMDLYVSDTGTGIEEKIMGRIFDPYFTTKGTGKGTGLGLAVSYGIVKKHGGMIQVVSSPGQGSTFHVYLPVMKTRYIEQAREENTVLRGGPEHILFVDDEYEIVASIVPMLERLGYRVTARTGSIDALEDFRKDPDAFDLLVTDMTMPNMTGAQLIEEIHRIRADLSVILCTGFSHQVNEENAGQMGINAFVMKPLVRDQLASLVRRILDGPGSFSR